MTLLSRIFAHDPEGIAFSAGGDLEGVGGGSVTYRQFAEDVDVMAFWLHEQGISTGTRLGIHLNDSSYWVWVAHLAAIRLGACHMTGSPEMSRRKALGLEAFLIGRSEPSEVAEPVRLLVAERFSLEPLARQLGVEPRVWPDRSAELRASRLALTSGTTGMPRALLWDYDMICARVAQAGDNAGPTQATRLYPALGVMTTAGFRYPLAVWQAGGTVFRRGRQDEVAAPSWSPLERSNLLVTSPINLGNALGRVRGPWPGRDERTIIVLGGRLPIAQRDKALEDACARLLIHYGSTETGNVASGDAALLDRHPGAVGYARADAEIEMVDDQDRPVGRGSTGIVRIRTAAMCAGYLADTGGGKESSEFRDGWFYPGDRGILHDDGLIAIAGRSSDAVNLGGLKLSLADIEGKLRQIAAFTDLCVIPVSLAQGALVAIVVTLAADADRKSLPGKVKKTLPLGCPFRIVPVRRVPRNAMGKVPRGEIAKQLIPILQAAAGEREKRVARRRQ